MKFFNRIQRHIHGPPPVSKLEQRAMAQRRAKTSHAGSRSRGGADKPELDPFQNQDLKVALEKFDNGVFFGTESALTTFRKFDLDADGYVSVKDLKKKLKRMNILTEKQTDMLIEYSGMDKKGFLDYDAWTKKFRPNMVWNNDAGAARTMFYHQTGTILRAQRNMKGLENTKTVYNNFRDSVRPDAHTSTKTYNMNITHHQLLELIKTSRMGNKPAWKNTFLEHQPAKGGC